MTNNHNFKDSQKQFAAHIRNPQTNPKPEGIDDTRMAVYRELFFNSINGLLKQTFPVLSSLLTTKQWQQLVRDFYQIKYNKTPYFTEIPGEFMHYLQTVKVDTERPFIAELSHYEWLELSVEKDSQQVSYQSALTATDLMTCTPIISPLLRLQVYQYPVHQISRIFQPKEASEIPYYLLVWRNQKDDVQFATLSAFAAALLSSLQSKQNLTGEQAIKTLMQANTGLVEHDFLQSGQQQLIKWYQQGIITGYQ